MAGFNGKWALVSSDNLIAVLKKCGVSGAGLEKAKVLEVPGDGGMTEEFNFTGSAIERTVYRPDGSVQSKGSLATGQWTDSTTLDGRKIKSYLTVEGDNEMSRKEQGPGYAATIHRKADGGNMTFTMTVGGETCVRKYSKK